MPKILLVEDEQALRETLMFLLESEGYEVIEAEDGAAAITQFEKHGADLILLDLMLPKLSGKEVCKQIRLTSDVPVIMLTAKDTEIDKVIGFEIGADDYVTKPYSKTELLARMKAVLRRNGGPRAAENGILEAGPVKMDIERHLVYFNGQKVAMPLKEFELLELLLENRNRVLTRGQIIDRVWGSNYFGDTKTLDVHIKRLRSKIEEDPARPAHLLTVRGLGYKYEV
ncbi:MAG: DNA-binding response regulator [Micrococcales bacterium]|jgi:two-component system response regulator RegX3|nr:DNA-binding response regulator [Microbacteriaceae bacterium]NBR25192.1 DNA-binding response regulator [Micrococcales bacterium]NBS62650.1 DNA-binding response regulator [Microbacteriaceae bacterium]NBS86306.1 DNA-binding response regulator [Micrococcales bacterium]NBX94658.1 DNA-binding response regulator [Actinomycetota bacterium]